MKNANRLAVIALAITLAIGTPAAGASGFAINTQSGSAIGNAFAGVAAAAEDASTIWYNPAGMIALSGTQGSLAANIIRTSFKFENTASSGAFASPGTGEGGDGGGWSLVPQGYLAMSVDDRWRIGLAVNTPFGLKTEYDAGWRGQLTALKSEVTAFNLNPAVAYRVSEALWIGAGVSVQYFETELTNAAGPLGTAKLEANDTGWGFNLGAMMNLSSATRIGIAYRSSISFTLDGTASFSAGNGVFNSGAKADLRVPESAYFGIFSAISENWDVMAGATWTRWSRLETVNVVRTSASALGPAGSLVAALDFNWSDTVLWSAGANYRAASDWKIRFGIGYDPASSNDATRTARLPDQSRLMLTVGARHELSRRASVDLAFAHEFVKDANIDNRVAGVPGALVGKFRNQVNVLSIQYNHQF